MIEQSISVEHHKKFEAKGKLIVVEGIDGSGKSTQIRLLRRWLISEGFPVFMTEWNSSEIVKEITSKGKKKARLTPTTFSFLHATDFADRYERNIFPLLRAGYIVLADRYVCSTRVLQEKPLLDYYESVTVLSLFISFYVRSFLIYQPMIAKTISKNADVLGIVAIVKLGGFSK